MSFPAAPLPAPHPGAPGRPSQLPLIDAFKAVGCQLIVLHHLAFYGPMSDATHRLLPDMVTWFSRDARMAVQVFLVVAGYLAARSLAPDGRLVRRGPGGLLWQRYLRVALPYVAALGVAIACTGLARQWMAHDSLPEPPELGQFVAHALLLHALADVDALTAGAWYVAIDLQLFALLLALLWLADQWPGVTTGRRPALACALVVLGVLASLFHFNRDADWDDWAIYFFGAYGLGALAWWCSNTPAGRAGRWLLCGMAAATLLALAVDFRERIALALLTALTLAWARAHALMAACPGRRALAYLSRISYAVFLLNFPIALVVNAWFTRFASPDPATQTLGVLLAWGVCNAAGAVFHHLVEQRLVRLGAGSVAAPAKRQSPGDTAVGSA